MNFYGNLYLEGIVELFCTHQNFGYVVKWNYGTEKNEDLGGI